MSNSDEQSQLDKSVNTKILNEDYFEELDKRLVEFSCMRKEAQRLIAGIVGKNLFEDDLFFTSAISRSVDILDGLSNLLKDRNITCAGVLLRIQIDNLMRVFAAFIAKDRKDFIRKFLEGVHIRKMLDDRNNKMFDGVLIDRISEYYPDIREIYQKASGYVHLSDVAFYKTWWADDSIIRFSIGTNTREEINPLLLEITDSFIYFLGLEFKLYNEVVVSKKEADQKLGEITSMQE